MIIKTHKTFAIAALLCFASLPNVFSVETLKVDLTDSIRPVTHCASGSLYGMTETEPKDIDGLVAPLKPRMFCQPPEGTNKNQHAFGDGYVVAKRVASTGAKVQITLPDLLPYWPYKWPGINSWLSDVKRLVNRRYTENIDNIHSYVIWNEPDGTWKSENGDMKSTVWKPTFELLRELDPETPIVGPCIAYYHESRMREFLTYCKQNNCLPDIICWHQWGAGGIVDAVNSIKKLQAELGIPERPYCINEYCAGSDSEKQQYEGCPGYSVPFIAKFERYGIESATISWWHVPHPGRLGSLLTDDGQKGGGWWLYKWYGDMEGYMARVTPPNDRSEGLDGFASVDRKNNCASLVLGGKTTGDVNVVFSKLPEFMGGKVRVKVERVTWKSINTPVKGTDLVSETDMVINNGSLTVPVKVESELYGYRVFITPLNVPQFPFNNEAATIPGKIEAENYDVAGPGFSFFDNDSENKGKEYRDDAVDIVTASEGGYAIGYTEKGEWLEYTVNVEDDKEYDVTAYVSNSAEIDGFQLFVDDERITDDYTIPQVSENWSLYEEVPVVSGVKMTKGEHVLKLQIVGSYVNVDWLKFTEHDKTSADLVFDYNDIVNISGLQIYDVNGKLLSVNDLRCNTIYIATTPDLRSFKFIKR